MPEHPRSRQFDDIAILVYAIVVQQQLKDWQDETRVVFQWYVDQCKLCVLRVVSKLCCERSPITDKKTQTSIQ